MVQTNESNVIVNFRVVGIYCYITGYTLDELRVRPESSIKDVQDRVCSRYNEMHPQQDGEDQFQIKYAQHGADVEGFKYYFQPNISEEPYDAQFAKSSETGIWRNLDENVTDPDGLEKYTTWQYYVSAIFRNRDNPDNPKNQLIVGRDPTRRNAAVPKEIQPRFDLTSLNSDLPEGIQGYELYSYNIIWRLLTIYPAFSSSIDRVQALRKERRRQRTSGRIV